MLPLAVTPQSNRSSYSLTRALRELLKLVACKCEWLLSGKLRVLLEWPELACAVQRRRFPVGESPTRQLLQPEATGATVEVTKRLKPSVKRATTWWQRECAGRNASERRASLEKVDARADPTAISGKADTAGEVSRRGTQPLRRGSGDSMYTREARATREAPRWAQR